MEIELIRANDKQLEKISREWQLALSLNEMKTIQNYYNKIGRNPTNVELNTIAQTWSEHCVHKTFKGLIKYDGKTIDSLFKSYITNATKKLRKSWCVNVFVDNAGIIEFDKNYDIAVKVETHNHPSALDPYGGAGTGSGGVFRDVIGVGAKPILSTDVLFFGPIDCPHEKLPRGVMHPKRLMKGVVRGIRDYGNRMGIPTANGCIGFDEGYIGNPLVYAGCVGILPKGRYIRNPSPADAIVLVGGKTGRDGIHGVTFASLELTEKSEKISSGAVQIGNAIEEKRVLDAFLRASEKGLYSAITDCGGGGLSSAIGEMGKNLGAEIDLEKVPLKYIGLEPWEIWISEAQERMILVVPKKNVKRIIEIFEGENTQATVIGKFRNDKKLIIKHRGKIVGSLDMDFLHNVPRVVRRAKWKTKKYKERKLQEKKNYNEDLLLLLASPNIASKEWIIRQYDHEVQAHTVLKPLQGVNSGPGDACVLKPLYNSYKGIVVSNGVNPKYSIDPYRMALSAIDEAIRNNVCVGGRRIALLDNFSWGNPEKMGRLGALVEACKACYDGALGFETPFISGKDSLYNEYNIKGKSYPIPHTLLISAIGIMPDIRKCVTMDLKEEGNPIYIIGRTKKELGGSHFYMLHNCKGEVPNVAPKKAKKAYDSLIKAMDKGYVRACHDCSEGGIAVAASEMSFAGDLGMILELKNVPRDNSIKKNYELLFSESNSRLLVEVKNGSEKRFEKIMKGNTFARIGETSYEKNVIIYGLDGNPLIYAKTDDLIHAWKSTFNW